MPCLHHNNSADERKQLFPIMSFSFPTRFQSFEEVPLAPSAYAYAYIADSLLRQRGNMTSLTFTSCNSHSFDKRRRGLGKWVGACGSKREMLETVS